MIRYKLTPDQLKQVTWPQDVLYDENGFAGYVMPKLDKTDSLVSIYSNGFDNKYDIRYRVLAAINLCVALKTVHELGQVCGDLNPQNICINLDTTDSANGFHVTLVDTDSYHFTADGVTYRCEVGLGDYIAPELQNKMAQGYDLKNVPLPSYTRETDLFALAVHIFALLMNGCHPFACAKEKKITKSNIAQIQETTCRDSVVAPQPIENMKNGFFPFYQKRDGITTPIYAPAFEYLPEHIQQLFIRTFVDGYKDPSKRASEDEWIAALKSTNFTQRECGEKTHYSFQHNRVCPICDTQNKIVKAFGGEPYEVKTPPRSELSESGDSCCGVFEETKRERVPVGVVVLMGLLAAFPLMTGLVLWAIYGYGLSLGFGDIPGFAAPIVGIVCIIKKKKKAFAITLGIYGAFFNLLYLWPAIQLARNIDKSKTSNPKYWWLSGAVMSLLVLLGVAFSIYWYPLLLGIIQTALFFALGHWMAYPHEKNN